MIDLGDLVTSTSGPGALKCFINLAIDVQNLRNINFRWLRSLEASPLTFEPYLNQMITIRRSVGATVGIDKANTLVEMMDRLAWTVWDYEQPPYLSHG